MLKIGTRRAYLESMRRKPPREYLLSLPGGKVIWPLQEISGSKARAISTSPSPNLDGDIVGATIGQPSPLPGIPYAISFDGSGDYIDIYSTELDAFLDPELGSLLIFAKVSGAGIWTDGLDHWTMTLLADADNSIMFLKSGPVDNTFRLRYESGGVAKFVNISGLTTTNYQLYTLTWDYGNDELKGYLNHQQYGSTLTGLAEWGNGLDSTYTTIGSASTVPTGVWDGNLAYACLFNRVLNAQEIAQLAKLSGVIG